MRHLRLYGIFLGFFCATYVLIQKTGILATRAAPYDLIFFKPPFLAGATLLGVCFIVTLCAGRTTACKRRWFPAAGVTLMVAGLWTSYLTRVDLELIVTEGQSVFVNTQNVGLSSGYAGKLARFPDFYLKLERLTPEFSSDRKSIAALAAEYVLLTDDGKAPRNVKTNSLLPSLRSGFLVSFKEFGYSPRYVMKGERGEELDSAFIYLNLFPPDNEDYFRLMSPHTYFVRYFPDGKGDSKVPTFNLRIARNKDLVLNRIVKLNEEVTFDGSNFSIAEVKQWTKFRVVRDPGFLLWPVAMLCLLAGLLMARFSSRNGEAPASVSCADSTPNVEQ